MIKIILLAITAFIFSGCVNKHGISLQPYDDCKEYYDFQGFYHKECGEKDIISFKNNEKTQDSDTIIGKETMQQGQSRPW